ncbi:hypothetical protein Glove_84g102 [Diversispora epigaea]|uniref:Protein kinase domain-containing protein n=1 Tax=Diversispora epigaea TaxID=1348612 RepID=A0A397J7C7_9GLOM|nr:hypothetical protein Glove_84g102 [Diversispora epigaea]
MNILIPQEIKKIEYCPVGHSSKDYKNFISYGRCSLCTKEHFIQEFKTWSSGNANIDKIIRESQMNDIGDKKLDWIPYDNFQNIEYIADGDHGSVYSAKLENGIKWDWNFVKKNWEYHSIGKKVALKEIKDSRYDIAEFLEVVKTINFTKSFVEYYGFSKNPSTQNYIFIMVLFDDNLHNFLTKKFWDLGWGQKINILFSITASLERLHEKNLVHCDLRGDNIFINNDVINLDLYKLKNDLILENNNKNNETYGSIPYIPPEVLRGNEFKIDGDIYSFGGIMYEIVAAQRPFADQAHDTYLMIDICNGVRPKVPDLMLNWIPEWYLDLMYRCWSDDPSERPTAIELTNLFWGIYRKRMYHIVDDVMRQLKIADENQQNISKFQKQELFSYLNKLHPQSWYIDRYIHTLHGLHDLLEEIKSGKSSDPNLLKPNKSTTSSVNTHNNDVETEIKSKQENIIL